MGVSPSSEKQGGLSFTEARLSPTKAVGHLRRQAQALINRASSPISRGRHSSLQFGTLIDFEKSSNQNSSSPIKKVQLPHSSKVSSRAKSKTIEESKITWHGPRGFGFSSSEKLKKVKKELAEERRERKMARRKKQQKMIAAQEQARRDAEEEAKLRHEELMNEKRLARKRKQRRVGGPRIAAGASKNDGRRRMDVNETLRDYSKVTESVWDIMRTWKGGPQFQRTRSTDEIRAISEHPQCEACTSKHRHAALVFTYRRCHICQKNFSLPEEKNWGSMIKGGWRDEALGACQQGHAPRRLVVQCASFGHKYDAARAWDVTQAINRLLKDNAGEFLEILDTLPLEEILKGTDVDWDELAEIAMRARAQQGGIKDDGRDEITLKIRYCMRTKGMLATQPHRHFGIVEVDCRFEPPMEEDNDVDDHDEDIIESDQDLPQRKMTMKKLGPKDKPNPQWWKKPGSGRYKDNDIRGTHNFGTSNKNNFGTTNARTIGNFFWLKRPILLELLIEPPLTIIKFALWGAVGPLYKEERGCVEITEWLQGRVDETGGEYLFIPRQENMRMTFGAPASYRLHQLYIEYLVEGKPVRRYSQIMREGHLTNTFEVGHVPLVAPLLVIDKAHYGVTVGDLQHKARSINARIHKMVALKKRREAKKQSITRGELALIRKTKDDLKNLTKSPLGFRDVRDTVQALVNRNGGHALEMIAGKDTDLENLFGDPLPGIHKQLKIAYHVNCNADSTPEDYLPSGRRCTFWMRRQGRLRCDALHDQNKYFDTDVNDYLFVTPEARLQSSINLRVDPCLPPLTIVKAYWERFKHGERLKPTRLDGPTWFEYATCQQVSKGRFIIFCLLLSRTFLIACFSVIFTLK